MAFLGVLSGGRGQTAFALGPPPMWWSQAASHEAKASLGPWICSVCVGVWAQNGASLRVRAGPHFGSLHGFPPVASGSPHPQVCLLLLPAASRPCSKDSVTLEEEGLLPLSFGYSARILAMTKADMWGLAGLDPGTPHRLWLARE